MFYEHHPHSRFAMLKHMVGRHHGRGWRGGFGGDFMGGGGHGAAFLGARKLAAGDLQLVLLALLAEQPAHGYELIKRLEERSGGFYSPSPGMIYPALTYLEEIGHASVEQEGTRKLYRITPDGLAHLAANRAEVDAILAALARIGSRMEHVREAFSGLDDADPAAADDVHRARHALKRALARRRGCSPAEARRIAEILDRATAEIDRL
jgi:DNA-binding PadR family transcriptional regulator